ncbi:MAG: insulinase family protein [Bacteroidales bacterium]|nr:insulinase family protein [Bacteroidales bacterium]
MRKSALFSAVLSLGLVGTLLVGCQSYEYQTFENDPLNAKIYTLPNGLKVYMTVNKEQPRIQTYIAVRTGGKNDPAETTGLAHYLEHLMFKGTTKFGTQNYEAEKPLLDSITDLFELYRSKTDPEERKAIYHRIDSISGVAAKYAIPNEYDKMMAMIGASGTNAYTSEDVTCYTEDIPSNQIENWAKIQGERFKNPVFRLFHTELEAVYEEKNISLTRDIRKEMEVVNEVLAPNHPYGKQTVIGTQEHLKNPSLINIRNYFNTWYVPNNVAICLSGDFDPDQMVRVITKYFGDWQSAEVPATNYPAIEPLQAPVTREVWGQEAENVILAWTFPGAADPKSEVVDFLSSVLYNGKAGLFDLDLNQGMKVLTAQAFVDRKTDASTLYLYGRPLPGQSLEEVRKLLLEEIQKVITAKFDGDLVSSVLTDYKLTLQKALENNSDRADMFVESFVNGQPWEEAIGALDRYSRISKMDLAYFAKKNLTEQSCVTVYKRQGDDPDRQVIDKPAITEIEANRDTISAFAKEIQEGYVAAIDPVFVDYNFDLQKGELNHKQPVLYKQNVTNQLFELEYVYEMGRFADKYLSFVGDYVDYLGTSTMTAEGVQRSFYRLGCDLRIQVSNRRLYVHVRGLDENLDAAVKLTEQVLNDAQPDEEVYENFISTIRQQRNVSKSDQRRISGALVRYATYGTDYIKETTVTDKELKAMKGSDLTNRLHNLINLEHRVLYYGPRSMDEVVNILNTSHATAEHPQKPAAGKVYCNLEPKETITYFAPFKANNSILRQSTTLGKTYDAEMSPEVALYNEYFGGSMNSIVFQEMRETRALAYSAYATLATPYYKDQDQYSFFAQITTQTDKLKEAYTHFCEIINDMPQSEAAMNNARTALVNRMRTERTIGVDVLWNYIQALDHGLDEDPNKNIYEKVQSLTLNDILAFQQKYIKNRSYFNTLVADPELVDLSTFQEAGKVQKVSVDEAFGY